MVMVSFNQTNRKGITVMFSSIHRHGSEDTKDYTNDENYARNKDPDDYTPGGGADDISDQQGNLKVQRFLPLLIHELRLILLDQPNNERPQEPGDDGE